MNQKQKRLLIGSLILFWATVFYVPQCGGVNDDFCGMMDGYEYLLSSSIGGVYMPALFVEWIAIAVNFICLYFLFKDE